MNATRTALAFLRASATVTAARVGVVAVFVAVWGYLMFEATRALLLLFGYVQ